MLLADIVRDYSQTVLADAGELRSDRVSAAFEAMEAHALEDLAPRQPRLARSIDMRYRGQGYELTIADCEDAVEAFHDAHEQRYGYADRARALEVVTLRLRALVRTSANVPAPFDVVAAPDAVEPVASAEVVFDGRAGSSAIYDRDGLEPGCRFAGPAIVVEYSSTTVVPPEWTARVDAYGNLVLERQEALCD
jgi:N-methylhydantoinase A